MDGTAVDRYRLDIWGCRGSRSLPAGASRVGILTSCYSLTSAEDVLCFDAGRGLTVLSRAILDDLAFAGVRRVHVLVTHSHMDHWEGLKDAAWLWEADTGLDLVIYGTAEALGCIRSAHEPPSFVPLDILSLGSLKKIEIAQIEADHTYDIGGSKITTRRLHHYSGVGDDRRYLDTLGYRVETASGPTVAYLCDHEPTPATEEIEMALAGGAHVALYDAHFSDLKDQTFGHGSQEHAAEVARRLPATLILATHHGTSVNDQDIEDAHRRHGGGVDNYLLAREGDAWLWDAEAKRFRLGP